MSKETDADDLVPMELNGVDTIAVQSQSLESNSSNKENETGCLLSLERLDRRSPEIWPENFPGARDFVDNLDFRDSYRPKKSEWLADFNNSERQMLRDFSSLTVPALNDKVKELENLAYQLGLEEANEMNRGKFLKVLD